MISATLRKKGKITLNCSFKFLGKSYKKKSRTPEKKHKAQMSKGRTNRGEDKRARHVPTTLSFKSPKVLQVVV